MELSAVLQERCFSPLEDLLQPLDDRPRCSARGIRRALVSFVYVCFCFFSMQSCTVYMCLSFQEMVFHFGPSRTAGERIMERRYPSVVLLQCPLLHSFDSLISFIHKNNFFFSFFFFLVGLLLPVQGVQCVRNQQDGLVSCNQLINEDSTDTISSCFCSWTTNRSDLSLLHLKHSALWSQLNMPVLDFR